MGFEHTSVLLHECIEALNIQPDGIYLDGTLGGAGLHLPKGISRVRLRQNAARAHFKPETHPVHGAGAGGKSPRAQRKAPRGGKNLSLIFEKGGNAYG